MQQKKNIYEHIEQYQTNYRIAYLLNYRKTFNLSCYHKILLHEFLWINMDILQIKWKYFLFQSILARQELVTGCPIYNIMLVDYPLFFRINRCVIHFILVLPLLLIHGSDKLFSGKLYCITTSLSNSQPLNQAHYCLGCTSKET